MKYDFDAIVDRRGTDSFKWSLFPEDVLPMWVADMDFRSAEPILQALQARIAHGIFGYSRPSELLSHAIRERLHQRYRWTVSDPDIVFLPGIVTALNVAYQAFAAPGEAVIAQPPVYFHFLRDPVHHGRILVDPPLVSCGNRYEIDFDQLERSIPRNARLFVLCNPHNPAGRVYTEAELGKIAAICLRHDLLICSDEIHCDLVYPPHRHIPIASLDPEIEARTITLMAPSKTYNVAGLECGYAIIKNPDLRTRWKAFSFGLIPGVNIAGHVAALAALRDGQDWLDQVLTYLEANRDYVYNFVRERMPPIRVYELEATYLAWMDCSQSGIKGNPANFFLKNAKVGMNDGSEFGKGGENFVRLNFACSRKILAEALDRMKNALKTV